MPQSRSLALAAAAGLLSLGTSLALAEPQNTAFVPTYDPATKSYFAVVGNGMAGCHCTWGEAQIAARRMEFKGVHGRLAIIGGMASYEFLFANFRKQTQEADTWIGLRYFCGSGKLEYSDGAAMPKGAFSAWDKVWNASGPGACSAYNTARYLGVAISPSSQGFHWFAKESHKFYTQMFVEFPTGAP